jgi:tRNA dimethylallyltransferase
MSRVLVVTGPTATGKSAVALALAERLPLTLISMDSAMVYREMDIGTAKPSRRMLADHPHALIDIRDPAHPYSVADFVADADAAVIRALAAGRLPVLVGGTMLYLRAFREGLADLPPADARVRGALTAEAEARGWPELFRELARVDPAAAAGMHPNNHVRIQRALEVFRITGKPLSEWWISHAGQPVQQRLGVPILEVAVLPPDRDSLAAPIEARFRAMLDAGLVDEVSRLKARGDLSLELPSMRSVGYRQVWEFLDGVGSHEHMVTRAVAATRALAKRQFTWLRSWPQVTTLSVDDPEILAQRIVTEVLEAA